MRLPDIDGFEVGQHLQDDVRTSRLPVIFVTERRGRDDRIAGLKLGAIDYITKPFDVQELRLRVRNALRRAGSQNNPEGESVASITGRLWEAGLIPNPGVFRTYLLYTGMDTTLKAGSYHFNPDLSPVELAQVMQSSVSSQVIFGILPGWRAEEVAASLPGSGLEINPDEFLQAVQNIPETYAIRADVPRASLEGFLFPTQYELPRTAQLEELLTK